MTHRRLTQRRIRAALAHQLLTMPTTNPQPVAVDWREPGHASTRRTLTPAA